MTSVILNAVKPPRQVATSPASTGEHTPGRVVSRGAYVIVLSSPQVLPFQGILRRFAQDDGLFDYRHVERKRNISRKGGFPRSGYKTKK